MEAAVYAEHYSNHPISRSLREAYGRPVDAARISDVEEIGGHGVTARVDGRQGAAGQQRFYFRHLIRRQKLTLDHIHTKLCGYGIGHWSSAVPVRW